MQSAQENTDRQSQALQDQIAADAFGLTGTLLASSQEDICLDLGLPDLHATQRYLRTLRPLDYMVGSVTLSSRRLHSCVRIELPMPFDGLFLGYNPTRRDRNLYAWTNTMKEAPGFRWITRETDGLACWRVALNDGDYWEGDGVKPPRLKATGGRPFTVLNCPNEYPDWFRELLPYPTCRVLHPLTPDGRLVRVPSWFQFRQLQLAKVPEVPEDGDLVLHPATGRIAEAAEAMRGSCTPTDEFLLDNKIISNYSHFLRTEFPVSLLAVILGACWADRELRPCRDAVWRCLEDPGSHAPDIAKEVWAVLARRELRMRLQHSLASRIVGRHGRAEPLEKLLNPVAAVSRRSRFLKFPSGCLDRIAVHRRQNHPSFLGAVCPVQTPESKSVGLDLHLARGAAVEEGTGKIRKARLDDSKHVDALGHAASLVPFFEHNDGARNMMAAKNLCQALPIQRPEPPLVEPSGGALIASLTHDLVRAGLVPDCTSSGGLALGKNLLVGYMPWYGYNSDDAVVIGEHVVDDGALDYVQSVSYSQRIPAGYVCDGGGIPEEGRRLLPGDTVVRFVARDGSGRPQVLTYEGLWPALIREMYWSLLDDAIDGWTTFQYVVETRWPLTLGDKLMGRHGNKGVIGRVEAAMPRLPADDSLGEFSGRPLDLILNPHGVISRMNVGQLLETQVGWLLARGIPATEFMNSGDETRIGEPFQPAMDYLKLQRLLKSTGLSEHGKVAVMMPGPDGALVPSRCPVFVGVQYVVRLDHIANRKAHARGRSPEYGYSVLSGQPVRGKSRGGAQKVGEMELWGLAAHEAWENLTEVLTVKSRQEPDSPLFPDHLRELLFAFGIVLDVEGDGNQLAFRAAADSDIRRRSHGEVTNCTGLQRREAFRFGCVAKRCSYRLGNAPLLNRKGDSVTLRDVLDHHGCRPAGFEKVGDAYELKFNGDARGAGSVLVFSATPRPETRADTLVLDCRIAPNSPAIARVPRHLHSFALFGRFPARTSEREQFAETNVPASALLEMFQAAEGTRSVGDMVFTCPEHSSRPLRRFGAAAEVLQGAKRSFYAQEVFGSLEDCVKEGGEKRWGHLSLPVPVEHPLATLFPSIQAEQPFPKLSAIPVLPLAYRMPLLGQHRIPTPGILKNGYYPVRACIHHWKQIVAKDGEEEAREILERRVLDLLKCLRELLPIGGKEGAIRSVGFGKRVDSSARMVIVPDPALEWGQVGLPLVAFIELFRDELVAWASTAQNLAEGASVAESISRWRWQRDRFDSDVLERLLGPCRQFLSERPEIVVILNRQPSLHKYSLQAFRPVLPDDTKAHVLGISPLVCAGFGADFDGDEMAVHRPLSDKAFREAATLMVPRRNFISIANGQPLCNFDQDFVLGTFFLYQPDFGYREAFLALLPEQLREKVPSGVCCSKKAGLDLIKTLCQEYPDDAEAMLGHWSRLAYRACTEMGVGFSFTELQELAHQAKQVDSEVSSRERVTQALRRVLDDSRGTSQAGYHFAAMAQSGARGEKQVPQILVSRGLLSPGALPYEMPESDKTFEESLLDGFALEPFWRTSLNARSSMCDKNLGTAGGGYLTRRLVFACSAVHMAEDCGVKVRNGVLGCGVRGGVCCACFGTLPDGSTPSPGFPIGLVAAQSIGERGTQLSMQSFHTGQRAVSLADVTALLDVDAWLFECTCSGCPSTSIAAREKPTERAPAGPTHPTCPDHGTPMRKIELGSLFGSEASGHFLQALTNLDAYKGLDRRFIELLWKILHYRGGGLRHLLESLDWSEGKLGFERQFEHIARLASVNGEVHVTHILDRVLFGADLAARDGAEEKGEA